MANPSQKSFQSSVILLHKRQQTRSASWHTARLIGAHTSVYAFSHATSSLHSDLTGRSWTMPILKEKKIAERKEGRNDIPVNPTCFWTSKSEVCENRNRKRKGRSLYRALEYPISEFSGRRKIQIGNWYNPKTYKKRERLGRRERDREKQRTEQIQRKECNLLWWI